MWLDYQISPEYEDWLFGIRQNPGKLVTFDDDKYEELDHFPKVRDALFSARDLVGERGAVRLDISSANKGIVVVTIHEPKGSMLVEGYDHSAVVRDAEFFVRPGDALAVGQGKRPSGKKQDKTPFSYVRGTLVGVGNEGIESDSDGIPIYYDPQVVHLYVDARNGRPVKSAEEVHFHYEPVEGGFLPQIEGIYIWAKNPVYYQAGEAPGEVAGEYRGKWDWVSETPLRVTGEISKVVYPRRNPKPATRHQPEGTVASDLLKLLSYIEKQGSAGLFATTDLQWEGIPKNMLNSKGWLAASVRNSLLKKGIIEQFANTETYVTRGQFGRGNYTTKSRVFKSYRLTEKGENLLNQLRRQD